MFGRTRKESQVEEEVEEVKLPQLYDESELWEIPGPREEDEVDTSVDYVDLGSLRIPAVPGMQIRAQAGEDGKSIFSFPSRPHPARVGPGMSFALKFVQLMKKAEVPYVIDTLATVTSLKSMSR